MKQDYSSVQVDANGLISIVSTLGIDGMRAQGFGDVTIRRGAKENGLVKVNSLHSSFLRDLTGGASDEERDTWKVKGEAAFAYVAGTADALAASMIEEEASGDGTPPMDFANYIVGKAEANFKLICKAGKVRRAAKAAVLQATDESVPLENVSAELDQVFAQMEADFQAAKVELQSG